MPIIQTTTVTFTCDQCGKELNEANDDGTPPSFIGLTLTFPTTNVGICLCDLTCLSAWTKAQIKASAPTS